MAEPQVLDLTEEQPAEDALFTLFQRAYPPTPTPAEETERGRERTRGRIAYALIGTLVAIVVATFAYIMWLSADFSGLSTEDLIGVMQGVGTTLLAPLVGLIGAVIGFYFGGQTAVQAASQATQAASLGAQTAREASRVGGQSVKEATQVGAQTATDAVTQVVPQAGAENAGRPRGNSA